MKVFLVNLDRDKAKLVSATSQLDRLGVAFERLAAVSGRDLSVSEKLHAVNRFRWWCAIGVPARDAEIGCALSHYSGYRKMAAGAIACFLEDDVVLSERFPHALAEIESWMAVDRPQVVILSDRTCQYGERRVHGIVRSSYGLCTDAYVINASAAAALLRANLPLQRPCDHWARWAGRGLIELYHYVPSVAEQDQATFGTSTQTGVVPISDWSFLRRVAHKLKRLIGKPMDRMLP